MVKRTKRKTGANRRVGLEHLEDRELLSTLLEGLAANNLTGSVVAPVGQIFDDPAAGMVGDDFAISAPMANGQTGEVYIIFGGPHLNQQPPVQQGCVNPPARVQDCNLIDTYLANRVALRIVGARPGDEFGFSVAGVGNVIGDSRPDVLIGAPFALNAGFESSGRAYLIGGEVIASVISAARAAGGNARATIDLSQPILPATTIRVFDGEVAGDQAGNSVAGLGSGHFIIGSPKFGFAPAEERGKVYVFAPLYGVSDSGFLSPLSTVLGPSAGAHLGGVPAEELTTTGFRGYSVTGMRNPALIPVADEQPNDPRYNVLGGLEPDALVGAPDACLDNSCTLGSTDRNGAAYLLSGTGLITIGGAFDLSSDADLKALSAIAVRGGSTGDRLGATVSSAGNFDGDPNDTSDFMIAAPRRDVVGGTTLIDAGEVYLVFGREVDDVPFPDGNCHSSSVPTGPQVNFRQCRDAAGLVVPLDASTFVAPGNLVGLTLRGDLTNEQAGVALAEAGNVVDPTGVSAVAAPSEFGVNEIVIGAPFRDIGAFPGLHAAGRAYVMFGSGGYQNVSGESRTLSLIGPIGTGNIFDGRNANDHYGISVAGAGNPVDPVGAVGDDVLIGANQVDVILPPAVTPSPNVGEVELLFGSTAAGAGSIFLPSPFPFVQPGPFGPQIISGGWWSYSNFQPTAGSVSQFPFVSSQVQGDFLFPPYTLPMLPNGSMSPALPSNSIASTTFYPENQLGAVELNKHGRPKKLKKVKHHHD